MTATREQLRQGMIQAVEIINPRVFATLVFTYEVTYPQAERYAVQWGHRVEHRAHGKRWNDFPAAERLRYLAFPEHPTSRFHYHAPAVGSPRICEVMIEEGDEIWQRLTGTGYGDMQWIESQRAVARYAAKAVKRCDAFENVVVYAPNPSCKA